MPSKADSKAKATKKKEKSDNRKEKKKESKKSSKDKPSTSSAASTKDTSAAQAKAELGNDPVKATTAPTTSEAPTGLQPWQQDPDAIQLFRRYDPSRVGFLTRESFLRLLRDFASPTRRASQVHARPRPPTLSVVPVPPLQLDTGAHTLNVNGAPSQEQNNPPLGFSLTDSNGIPLGFERTGKNTEFEAGQLFERYDKDHTGMMTLEKFHPFFQDFKTQLRRFVEDMTYYGAEGLSNVASNGNDPPPSHECSANGHASQPLTHKESTLASIAEEASPRNNTNQGFERKQSDDDRDNLELRAKYRSLLWRLRKLCKEQLSRRRELLLDQMQLLEDHLEQTKRVRSPSSSSSEDSSAGSPLAAPASHGSFSSSAWSPTVHAKQREFRDNRKALRRFEQEEIHEKLEKLHRVLQELDQILHETQTHLRLFSDNSSLSNETLRQFIRNAPNMIRKAHAILAMPRDRNTTKDRIVVGHARRRKLSKDRKTTGKNPNNNRDDDDDISDLSSSGSSSSRTSDDHQHDWNQKGRRRTRKPKARKKQSRPTEEEEEDHDDDDELESREDDGEARTSRRKRGHSTEEATISSMAKMTAMALQESPTNKSSQTRVEQALRVKDQMIWQLLQERKELRKQKTSMEHYLHEFSQMSTNEMHKWARLTDEMQREIEFLRSKLEMPPASHAMDPTFR